MEKLRKQDLLKLKKNKEKNRNVLSARNQAQKEAQKEFGNADEKPAGRNLRHMLFTQENKMKTLKNTIKLNKEGKA